MFRKLVTDFSYSPSSIEQLGAFASKLKREQILRETGLIFLVFSFAALAFTIFDAPESVGFVGKNHLQQFVSEISRILPHFSAQMNAIFAAILLIFSLLLILRAKQLSREIREIRRNFNIGSISDEAFRKKSHQTEFAKIMTKIREKFGFWTKLNSRILHFRPMEIAAEFFANILLRPIALVGGGVFALIFTALMYLFAKYFGFSLAGSEWLAGFIFGWIFGNIFDWTREGFAKHPDDL